jgi:bacteriocin-like protein
MSKKQKSKQSKQQRRREELSDEQLETVSGGVIAIIAPQRQDEGPKENITFVYGTLSIGDPHLFAAKK